MKGEELVDILKGEVDHKEKDVAQSGVISEQVCLLCARISEALRGGRYWQRTPRLTCVKMDHVCTVRLHAQHSPIALRRC